MVAVAGLNVSCVVVPAVTMRAAVPVMLPSFPVTVCGPATVLEQEFPVQVPLLTVKAVEAVTSPIRL